MKYIPAVVLIGLLVAVPQARAQAPSAFEQELMKLENDWSEAVLKTDAATLQRLYNDSTRTNT